MSNTPKVSVIMAEFNTNEDDLRASILSILQQTYSNFEFIIVDDASKNDTESIISDFGDSRIRLIKNKTNRGLVYSLNRAIKNANSDYLIRMDTDDLVTADRIEKLVSFADVNPEFAVVSSRAREFTGKEELGVIGTEGEKTKKAIMRGDVPVHAAALIRKAAIVSIGNYKDFKRAEDLVLWCELLMAGARLYVLNDVLYFYRVNPDDYKKRTIRHRGGEIKARLHYYPKMGAGPLEYVRIVKSVVAGLLPIGVVRLYRSKFVVEKG